MTETTAPAAWYTDPEVAGQLRYWDGARWTEQVAPAMAAPGGKTAVPHAEAPGTKRRLSAVAIIAIVLGAMMLVVGLVVGGFLLAAKPLVDQQRANAFDAAARGDAVYVSMLVAEYAVEHMALPEVTVDGDEYVVAGPDGEYGRAPVSPGVELAGYETDGTYFCLGIHAAEGDVQDVHYSADEALEDGPCP